MTKYEAFRSLISQRGQFAPLLQRPEKIFPEPRLRIERCGGVVKHSMCGKTACEIPRGPPDPREAQHLGRRLAVVREKIEHQQRDAAIEGTVAIGIWRASPTLNAARWLLARRRAAATASWRQSMPMTTVVSVRPRAARARLPSPQPTSSTISSSPTPQKSRTGCANISLQDCRRPTPEPTWDEQMVGEVPEAYP